MPDIGNLGASGAVVLVVGMFLKFMHTEAIKRDATYAKVALALDRNTQATKKADEYLRKRNGRDAESHHETLVAIQAIPKTMQIIADKQAEAIVAAVKIKDQTPVKIKDQHVEHQHIEHESVSKGDQ